MDAFKMNGSCFYTSYSWEGQKRNINEQYIKNKIIKMLIDLIIKIIQNSVIHTHNHTSWAISFSYQVNIVWLHSLVLFIALVHIL